MPRVWEPVLQQNLEHEHLSLPVSGGEVNTSSATAPTTGQVLTATSATAATWQTPSTTATALSDTTGSVNVSNAPAPVNKQILIATGASTATWQYRTPTITSYSPAGGATQHLDVSSPPTIFVVTEASSGITLAIDNAANGILFVVEIIMTTGGSVTFFSTIKWVGGTTPTLTTTNGKKDSFLFRCTGTTTFDGYVLGQNI